MEDITVPQVLGVFPAPASYLLLPVEGHEDTVYHMLQSGEWPADAPGSWRFFSLALEGQQEEALHAIEGDSLIAQYNRFILEPSLDRLKSLHPHVTGSFEYLLHTIAYLYQIEPEPAADNETIQPPVRAFLLAARAGYMMKLQDEEGVYDALEQAIAVASEFSPALVARLKSVLVKTKFQIQGPNPALIAAHQDALQALKKTSFVKLQAEMWLSLGELYHDLSKGGRQALLEAAKCYTEASQLCSQDAYPELYALAQNNLALAYLATPLQQASDQLRVAIAISALKEALKVYTRDAHPEMWASTTLNLANALQHAPSGNPEEHLWQSVELYEEILEVRTADSDPLGYARVLANQGNALAHLGAFSRAIPRLTEAQKLFTENDYSDAATTVNALLKDIENQQALHGSAR